MQGVAGVVVAVGCFGAAYACHAFFPTTPAVVGPPTSTTTVVGPPTSTTTDVPTGGNPPVG